MSAVRLETHSHFQYAAGKKQSCLIGPLENRPELSVQQFISHLTADWDYQNALRLHTSVLPPLFRQRSSNYLITTSPASKRGAKQQIKTKCSPWPTQICTSFSRLRRPSTLKGGVTCLALLLQRLHSFFYLCRSVLRPPCLQSTHVCHESTSPRNINGVDVMCTHTNGGVMCT